MTSHPASPIINVLLADDHPMMLLGIRGLLSMQEHIKIVGEASDGEEVIAVAKRLHPDIVVMDISMPGLNGFQVTSRLQEELPKTKVIIHTMHSDREYIHQFVRCGAAGYVVKTGSPDELVHAIESVHKGGAYFSPSVAVIILQTQQSMEPNRSRKVTLSPREEQVLCLIAKGKSTKTIALVMSISGRTVSKYREQLMEKLDIHTIAGLTLYAIVNRYVDVKST